MTVQTDASDILYTGDGVSTNFPVPFYFQLNDQIFVEVDGAPVTPANILGAGNPDGGEVILIPAPADGAKVYIYRQTDFLQETDYPGNGKFPARSVEANFDKLTMQDQELLSLARRSLKFPPGETPADLPAPDSRAGKILAFDDDGALILRTPNIAEGAIAQFVRITDEGKYFDSDNVEGALQETGESISILESDQGASKIGVEQPGVSDDTPGAPAFLQDYANRVITVHNRANDLTGYLEDVISEVSNRGGGAVGLIPDVFEVDYVKLYSGIRIVGSSYGNRMGSEGSTLRAKSGTGATHFITRATNQTRNFTLDNLTIDGNRADNPTLAGMLLYQEDDGINLSNDQNTYFLLRDTTMRGFGDDCLVVGGDGTGSGGYFYNIRNLFFDRVTIRDNIGRGLRAQYLTDSYLRTLLLSQNRGGALNVRTCSNVYWREIKGFYNGSDITDGDDASMYFNATSRCLLELQAQEEYGRGVFFRTVRRCKGSVLVDANGYPAGTPAEGLRMRDVTDSTFLVIGDSFHAPDFLQSRTLALLVGSGQSFAGLNLNVISVNQANTAPLITVESGGSLDGLSLRYNGQQFDYGSTSAATRTVASEGNTRYARDQFALGSSNVFRDLDFDDTADGMRRIRLFRNTNQAARVSAGNGRDKLVIHAGDNTSSETHYFEAGGNAKVGEGAWNGSHTIMGSYHLWVDSSGRLRIKSGGPTSDTDGVVVGTQS